MHPLVGLGVGQDRLAERVDVDLHAVVGAAPEMLREVGIVGRDDDAVRLGLDLAEHERHDEAGEPRRREGAGAEQQRVEASDRIRVVRGHDVSEPASGEPGFVDPQHLVGHREDQSAALFVGEERAESLASAPLCT